jgi:hypothetical protein
MLGFLLFGSDFFYAKKIKDTDILSPTGGRQRCASKSKAAAVHCTHETDVAYGVYATQSRSCARWLRYRPPGAQHPISRLWVHAKMCWQAPDAPACAWRPPGAAGSTETRAARFAERVVAGQVYRYYGGTLHFEILHFEFSYYAGSEPENLS